VDFGFTEEQEMLRATARQFVADVCPAERAKEWDEESAVPLSCSRAWPSWAGTRSRSPNRTVGTAAARSS
jgi:alkylation response protein AidB-like acyl-CoA dehydrogenase